MKTHVINRESFGVFEQWQRGRVWMIHFLWGKKDFRLFLERPQGEPSGHGTVLLAKDGLVVFTRLQFLHNFEWYDYDEVTGHGLGREEIRWRKDKTSRRLELPKGFRQMAIELACREFGLERERKAS